MGLAPRTQMTRVSDISRWAGKSGVERRGDHGKSDGAMLRFLPIPVSPYGQVVTM